MQETEPEIRLHQDDLPDDFDAGECVAVDTETLGLDLKRDRLCLVQVSCDNKSADLVRVRRSPAPAPNLVRILSDPNVTKLFHYARFDVGRLLGTFDVLTKPIYCTKIASVFARTYASRHSLDALCRELLGFRLNKEPQSSNWAREELVSAQLAYAAGDVLHLHDLRMKLDEMLRSEGREELAAHCFRFLPRRAQIDLAGWNDVDVFAHDAMSRS